MIATFVGTRNSDLPFHEVLTFFPGNFHRHIPPNVLHIRTGELPSEQCLDFLTRHEIDYLLHDGHSPRLFFADMDSTIITCECVDEIADMAGKRPEISAITAAAMEGGLDFRQALLERLRMLKGLPVSALQQVYDERIRLQEGAEFLLQTLRRRNIRSVLISGGFTFFTGRIAERLGFDEHFANVLEEADGKLTGGVIGDVIDKRLKLDKLNSILEETGLSPASVIAIGDGANDIPMLQAAGFGVGFHAKRAVQKAVRNQIRFHGLEVLAYAIEGQSMMSDGV